MKRWGLAVLSFKQLEVPNFNIVKKPVVDKLLEQAQKLFEIQAQSAEILAGARKKRSAYYAAIRQRLKRQQVDFEEAQATKAKEAIQAEVEAAVKWLVSADQVVEQTQSNLQAELSRWLADQLKALSQTLPWTELLAENITKELASNKLEANIEVMVNTDQAEAISKKLPPEVSAKLQSSSEIPTNQAVLKSPWVEITFDLVSSWETFQTRILQVFDEQALKTASPNEDEPAPNAPDGEI